MPSQICNEDGTKLISPIGGSVQVWYHDFKDDLGRTTVVGLTQTSSSTQTSQLTEIPINKISINSKFTDASDRPLLENPVVGHDLIFATEISNNDKTAQIYSYILQVKDTDDKVLYLKLEDGSVAADSKDTAKLSWTPKSSGKYTVEIFLWNQLEEAVPLIPKTGFSLSVVDKPS